VTVVTSTAEPVSGVIITAVDEVVAASSIGGCGPTDTSGQCTITGLRPGDPYSLWLQGYHLTGSGAVRPAAGGTYQPIILHVTGRTVPPPPAGAGDGRGLAGRALTSSGEFIPGIGVCAGNTGDFAAGVSCVTADSAGYYRFAGYLAGQYDVRLVGYVADRGGPYINGSAQHVLAGTAGTIVVTVGPPPLSTESSAAPSGSGSTAPRSGSPKAVSPVRRLAGTGAEGFAVMLFVLGALLMLCGLALGLQGRRSPAQSPPAA
jgi:hypothetical protein